MPKFSIPRTICTCAGLAAGALLFVAPTPAVPAIHGSHVAVPVTTGPPTISPSNAGSAPAAATPVLLEIRAFTFPSITVTGGATVEVFNGDPVEHTVTAADGGFDVLVAPGGTASFVAPSAPGTYQFTCAFHPGMVGTLVVR